MKKIKIITILILIICMLFSMTACKRKQEDIVDPEAEVEFLIVLVTDKNGLDDGGINDSCWAGLQRAAADIEATKVEVVETEGQYADSIRKAVKLEPDIIICPNAEMANVLAAMVNEEEFINELFVLFNAEVTDAYNVTPVYFNQEQSAFLAGVVSALTTQENVVGFIGSQEGEQSDKYLYGFTAGVVSSNPYAYISTNYINTTADARTAKETAVAQHKLGADVIFHVVGAAGRGIIDAAEERGFKVISLLPDQSIMSPEAVLCTIAQNGDAVCYDIVKRLTDGSFDGSEMNYGIAEDGFYISNEAGNIPEEILQTVKGSMEKIKQGLVSVPYDNWSYQTFINGGEPEPVDESGIINTDPEMDI